MTHPISRPLNSIPLEPAQEEYFNERPGERARFEALHRHPAWLQALVMGDASHPDLPMVRAEIESFYPEEATLDGRPIAHPSFGQSND